MEYFKYVILISSIASTSHAGLYAPTMHSRANCNGINESVTWQANVPHNWRVDSYHWESNQNSKKEHIKSTKWAWTTIAIGYCLTEPPPKESPMWIVGGYHYKFNHDDQRLEASTEAIDCNVYDGWWG